MTRQDSGPGCNLQHPRRFARGHPPRDIDSIIGEDQRPQALIIMLRDAADESGDVVFHIDL